MAKMSNIRQLRGNETIGPFDMLYLSSCQIKGTPKRFLKVQHLAGLTIAAIEPFLRQEGKGDYQGIYREDNEAC